MAKRLNTEGILFTAAADAVAKEDFKTKEHATHKATGLPLWTVEGFLVDQGESEIVKLNIASAEQPKIVPFVQLALQGDLLYVPYIANGTNRVASSYTLVGQLTQVRAGKSE